MPTITAKNTLLSLWPLIHRGRDRKLSTEESNELGRLCEILKKCIPGLPAYTDEARSFCVLLHESGVFETGEIRDADALLHKVDELRHLLN